MGTVIRRMTLYWISREKILDCRIYADRIEYNEIKLPMVPSAAASLAMLRSYFVGNCEES